MAAIVAIGAVSPFGVGDDAWSNGPLGAPARLAIARDRALVDAGAKKPFAARAVHLSRDDDGDRATSILLRTLAQIEHALPAGARLGVALGSSSGGMASAEALFAARRKGETIPPALADAATYHAPFRALIARLRACGRAPTRTAHLLTACSASTLAMGIGTRWLDVGACDVVIAGGYDALTTFVAAGFEALGATTASPPPRPFRLGRDGMSLGEGCALFVLRRDLERDFEFDDAPALARIVGFGASGDAVHLTAPDRTGGGLARSAVIALQRANVAPSSIDLVSVHGTSTAFNDPMEKKAIAIALGDHADVAAVHAAKASIGHTLGAAGALETALVVDAIRRELIPATAGEGTLDPEASTTARDRNEARKIGAALKLSAAFGGANAALVVVPTSSTLVSPAIVARAVDVVAQVEVPAHVDLGELAQASGIARERLGRMDSVCHLALAAVSALALELSRERLRGAGVVLGSVLATIDVNAIYDDGLRRRGFAHAEGRRFAYTTPNAAAGECAIAFGLTGPNLAVGRGVDAAVEARELAHDLVACGDAEQVVVIDVDAEGPMTTMLAATLGLDVRFGARATLLRARSG